MTDIKTLKAHYSNLKTEREQYAALWQSISRFVGIKSDIDYLWDGNEGDKSRQLDEYIDDPTAALSVTQSGDYLYGILWGTGNDVLEVVPSREVLDLVDPQAVQDYYNFVTEETLEQMNHAEAGLNGAMKCHVYDQQAFGTSGIGAFKNKRFETGQDGNAIIFKGFGVDSMVIDEGRNGLVDYMFATYHWDAVRIVSEFCCNEEGVDKAKFSKMPIGVRQSFEKRDTEKKYIVVFAMMPQENYEPKKKGKKGARFKGVWFFDDNQCKQVIAEEYFKSKPVAIARAIKVRGETYGRANGTVLLSTIRLVNFAVGQTIEVIEKMARPSLGMFGDGLFGDSVLDTSPDGLTVFNPEFAAQSKDPVFPMADVGDPSPLVQWLVPYLNEKIATAFKIDVLLDFSSAKDMTATESLQRFAIRGKSLAGLLGQQKVELLDVIVPRSVELLHTMERLGVMADDPKAKDFTELGKVEKIIPAAVAEVMKAGKPWFRIKYKNELEQLTNTRNIENLMQYMQGAGAIAQLFPQIVKAVDWYKLLDDWRESLNIPSDKMIDEKEFVAQIQQDAKMMEAQIAMQLGQQNAAASKDSAQASKAQAEANNKGQ